MPHLCFRFRRVISYTEHVSCTPSLFYKYDESLNIHWSHFRFSFWKARLCVVLRHSYSDLFRNVFVWKSKNDRILRSKLNNIFRSSALRRRCSRPLRRSTTPPSTVWSIMPRWSGRPPPEWRARSVWSWWWNCWLISFWIGICLWIRWKGVICYANV